MDDLIKEFLVESREGLDRLDQDLVKLEKDPSSRELIGSIFRTIHTIKGTSGFLALHKLESVAHVGENLLSRLRDGKLVLTRDIATALLATVDAIRQMLSNLEATGKEGERDDSKLIETLTALQTPGTSVSVAKIAPAPAASAPAAKPIEKPSVSPVAPLVPAASAPTAATPAITPKEEVKPAPVAVAAESSAASHHSVADTTIRVDVSLLDRLMNLVGELVLARNQVLQFGERGNTALNAATQRLNLITTELQEGVMKTRMQPIGNVWSKFPRVVRDLAQTCGKQIRLEMEGEGTELDKTIIEAIKDPLTHLVRNSVDHGIETPEARAAKGKAPEGRLALRAYHEGGQVNIEIIDDGAGVDPERVKSKAVQKNLLTAAQASSMSDRDAVNLIFLPGFSTAEKITNVSGRGVGMDVVKTNIEKIGGMVEIISKAGSGTTIKIKIPLTLAIIPALIVRCGGERFAIPQVSLLELVRLDGEKAKTGIEEIHGAPVYRLRGQLLPLVHLHRELQVPAPDTQTDAAVNIVVLQAGERPFGLVVDDIQDTVEIVVKPLGKHFKGLTCYSGATIMGDGRVALILDVIGLAQRAHLLVKSRERNVEKAAAANTSKGERQTLLLFGLGDNNRVAMPLSTVARLEEFPVSSIERSGPREVVQYRGHILPLVRIASILGGGESDSEATAIQAVVYRANGRSIGLVVGRIEDIVEENVELEQSGHRDGILGTAIIQSRVTDLLDVPAVIRAADPAFFEVAAVN